MKLRRRARIKASSASGEYPFSRLRSASTTINGSAVAGQGLVAASVDFQNSGAVTINGDIDVAGDLTATALMERMVGGREPHHAEAARDVAREASGEDVLVDAPAESGL